MSVEQEIPSLQELRNTAAVLHKLVKDGDPAILAAAVKVSDQIAEILKKPQKVEEGVSPGRIEYVPPSNRSEFIAYLSTIKLADFIVERQRSVKGTTTVVSIYKGNDADKEIRRNLQDFLSAGITPDSVRIRSSKDNQFFIDVRSGTFDIERFKSALSCQYLTVGAYTIDSVSRASAFAPAREVVSPEDARLFDEPVEKGKKSSSFFRWIREEMAANHPLVELRCDKEYDHKKSSGLYPLLIPTLEEFGIEPTGFRRRDLSKVVSAILQRAKVDDAEPVVLSQHIADFPFDQILKDAVAKEGIGTAITTSLQKRILNRLRISNTFLSLRLIQDVVDTFTKEGCPFDSLEDISQEFLEEEFKEQLSDLGFVSLTSIVSAIRKYVLREAVVFPCAGKLMHEKIIEAFEIIDHGRNVRSASTSLSLNLFEDLVEHCELLQLVKVPDQDFILRQIRERSGNPGKKITPATLNGIVSKIQREMPAFFGEPVGGQGGRAKNGRVIRSARGLGG